MLSRQPLRACKSAQTKTTRPDRIQARAQRSDKEQNALLIIPETPSSGVLHTIWRRGPNLPFSP